MQQYLAYCMYLLNGKMYLHADGTMGGWANEALLVVGPGFANYVPDNNYAITWQENMTETLEWYAQNATLSLLSGQIFALGSADGPELLENFTTNCDIILTVYEYTPSRLFTTYGVAVFSTILCIVAGCISIKQNGVEESMDFSRFLRAVLNERMYNVKDKWDMETRIKADSNAEGSFAPFLDPKI